jgi:predicted nucleotidyltransferase
MAKKSRTSKTAPLPRWYRGADVPMRVIRRFARQVAERFQPDKIILFGSYAYGTPHADSDVDILVIMPARNQIDQAVRIDCAIDPPFPLDLIVRTPKNMKWRLEEGDSFLREITAKGKVLYEKNDRRVGTKSRGRLSGRRNTRSGRKHDVS